MKRTRCKGKAGVLESLEEKMINSNDLYFVIHKRGMKNGGDSKTSTGNGVAHCAVLHTVCEKTIFGSDVLVHLTSLVEFIDHAKDMLQDPFKCSIIADRRHST